MLFGLTTEAIMWAVGGYMAKDQISEILKPKGQGGGTPTNAPPQHMPRQLQRFNPPLQGAQGPQAAQDSGEYAPGMPMGRPVSRRKPLGPVALDAHIEEGTEKGVWQCLAETNETEARQFAVALARGGLPVAAAVVSLHVHLLEQIKAAQEAHLIASGVASSTAKTSAPVYASPEQRKEPQALTEANGIPVIPPQETPGPFVPRVSTET
jgi:hypothetical protein